MDEFTANTIRNIIKAMRSATIIINCEIQQFIKYDTTYIRTVLTFANGSKESVECPADKADSYYGFTTCYAKHIAKTFINKNISDMADYWLITKPKREAEARAKAEIQRAEEQRLAETIVTEARVRKLLNKFVDEDILPENWSLEEMPIIAKNLTKAVYEDCVKEEPETVKQIDNFGKVANGIAMKLARNIASER